MQEPLSAMVETGELDLRTVLDAWNVATERLQQTHELLRGEVKRLTDELEAKNHELAKKNRLADLGQMASHVAHEVRNGLVPMKLYLSLLKRRLAADAPALELLEKTNRGFLALEHVVTDLLQFSTHREPQCAWFDLHELCEELCDSLWPQLEAQRIETTLEFPPESPCYADRDTLRRGLLNLILNALDVLPHGGTLTISGQPRGHAYELTVADSGPGLPAESFPRLFEPFYSTKATGTGLGLSIVERIVHAHGGEIRAENPATGGAAFTLVWPQPHRPSTPTRIAA